MKARVKATGEIIEIGKDCSWIYVEKYDKTYYLNELEPLDVNEISFPKDEPDYWEKLRHQAAISIMPGLLDKIYENFARHSAKGDYLARIVAAKATEYATALINELKEITK